MNFFIRFFYSLYVKDFSTTKTNKFDQFVFDKLNEIFDLELNDVNKIEDMSNLFSQKKLSSIIDAEATVLTKEQIPQFIEFLKKSTKKEYERKSGIIPDNFSLNKILQNKPDLLNGLDCFQIKKLLYYYTEKIIKI